jgi:hypothetical protein
MFGGELEVEPGRAINLNRDLIMIDSEKTPGPEGVLVSRTVDSAEPPTSAKPPGPGCYYM